MQIVLLSTGSPEADEYPAKGGVQYQIHHMASELQERGHEPIIVSRRFGLPPDDGIRFEQIPVGMSDEIVSRLVFSWRAASRIARLAPDFLFTYERFSALFPSRLGIPTLFFTSNYDAMEFYRSFALERHPLNAILFPLKKRIEELVMRRADRVVALNEDIERYLHDRNILETTVIPNGIDPDKYHHIEDGDFVYYAGRLNEVKGCDVLIDAFETIEMDFPEIDLVISGDGDQREALRKKSTEFGLSDRIRFTGWLDREELHETYGRCRTFVLPSYFETFGIVVLEAMASRKPVIASDITGPRNIITEGEDGLLFEAGNIEALADRLRRVLESPSYRRTLGCRARTTVEQRYAFSSVVDQLLESSLGRED